MISHKKEIKQIINPTEKIFFRDTEKHEKNSTKNYSLNYFNSISRYYSSLRDTGPINPIAIADCLALQLADSIMEKITTERVMSSPDNSLGDEFYSRLAASTSELTGIIDTELLVIFLKQMVNILRSGNLIAQKNSQVYVTELFTTKDKLYPRLLRSFWNECDWRVIFPSSPEAAEMIHDNRESFLELVKGVMAETSVEDIANDFFNTSGICEANDYFMISFIDFYLLTWLKHFGIIEYNIKGDHEIVYISISDYGRKVLNSLL